MKKWTILTMDLQLFGEGDPNPAGEPKPNEPKPGGPEFDAAVSKAVEKALENSNKKWQAKLDEQIANAKEEAKTEAERMAQMNAEQIAEYERDKRMKDLEDRERAITARELRTQSISQLEEAKLPHTLVDLFDLTDSEKAQASFVSVKDAWEKAFGSWEEALNKKVKEELKNSIDNPLGGSSNSTEVNPWVKETFNLTLQGKIMLEDPERAKILKARAKKIGGIKK